MKKTLLLGLLVLGLLWLAAWEVKSARPARSHIASIPVIRKPEPLCPARPKHVSLVKRWMSDSVNR